MNFRTDLRHSVEDLIGSYDHLYRFADKRLVLVILYYRVNAFVCDA